MYISYKLKNWDAILILTSWISWSILLLEKLESCSAGGEISLLL
jgi:hypothetical protein